jgi:hypothetical protein
MIIKPRYTILAGLVFIALAVVYGIVSQDWGGVTLLGALGLAVALMAFVLIAGSPRGDEQ